MQKYYKVAEAELRELLRESLELTALECGGIDNWDYYSNSKRDWLKR